MRHVVDLSKYGTQLECVYQACQSINTKRASGAGVRVGGSARRGNISQYKYINTKKVLLEHSLKSSIDTLTTALNIKPNTITHNILHFEPGDFLDWQDYYMWKKKSQFVGSMMIIGPVIKFFSIALTDGNCIEFKDKSYNIHKHHGIVFDLSDIHRVPKVDNNHQWLVLGVAKHIDINSQIN